MGASVETRFARWVDLVGDLLISGPQAFPVEVLMGELCATFGAHVAWNWSDVDGSYGFHTARVIPGWPPPGAMDRWVETEGGLADHPLLTWFAASHDPTAMTIGRVPASFQNAASMSMIRDELAPFALDQQLSIPYRMTAQLYRAFVVAKTGRDFCSEDLDLARRIQGLVVLLARQCAVLSNGSAARSSSGAVIDSTGLTKRERAVLGLLAEGLTAAAIGTRLGISPRTVQVHLDHTYRKLAVHDRLMAVQVGREAGLLVEPGTSFLAPHASVDCRLEAPGEPPPERRFSWTPGIGTQHLAGTP